MSEITLHTPDSAEVTAVRNTFIDCYMPRANGEYVKLYLYLLRLSGSSQGISISKIAEIFEYTEKDILRALSYWEKEGLMKLSHGASGELDGISFVELSTANAAPTLQTAETAVSAEVPEKVPLTADRMAQLSEQEDIAQLLFIAAQYLGKTLSPTEISNILYFYDTLHFSTDLIEYLVEYCVSKGSKSSRYMEKVAMEWSREGISTVEQAKNSTNLYNRNYYSILNAFGIKGRGLHNLRLTL